LVQATGEALAEIETRVLAINDHIHSIATSAREQSTGLQEVNTAVNQMDQVTQQNAAMVEETSAATHKLSGEADGLLRLVSRFKIEERTRAPVLVRPETRRAESHRPETHRPVQSPARRMINNVALAFSGSNAAPAKQAASQDWEEF
jgi:methyl-accepting chemotaxis protein